MILTKNEEMLMLAVLHLKDEAYGVHIRRYVKTATGKQFNYGTLYRMLDLLVQKEMLERVEGIPLPSKGGRRKNYYSMTRVGVKVLQETYEVQRRLWDKRTGKALSNA